MSGESPRIRIFRNSDPPALVAIWNRCLIDLAIAQPLTLYELEDRVFTHPFFEARGLLVAEHPETRAILGFAHVGFGPSEADQCAFGPHRELGTIAMLVVDPSACPADVEPVEVAAQLILEADQTLRDQGALVRYAGGQFPLNPFYWGIYGGSEFSGVLSGHDIFLRALQQTGFQPCSTTVLLESNVIDRAATQIKGILIKTQTSLEIHENAEWPTSWHELALSPFHRVRFELRLKSSQQLVATALTWDMGWYQREAHRRQIGIIGVEVHPDHRRKGYARFLMGEIRKYALQRGYEILWVQASATNVPALALYEKSGFHPFDTATLFRR